nr:zinc finger, CCHC-type [Tanacetum cinerariifolium]
MMKNVFGLRWNCRKLKGIVKLRFFRKRNIRLGGRSRRVMFLILVIREDTTMSTYLVNRSSLSAIGFIKPIDMLGIFGWLASIKKGMLEPVKVKCIFRVYHKNIVGNKLWRLDNVTSKVRVQCRCCMDLKFEVEPLGDHTFEVEPQENVNQGASLQEVQTQDLIYYHLARDREQYLACELFGYREDINEVAFAVVVVEKIYAHESPTFNNTVACEVISKWKVGMKDDMDAWLDVYVLSNNDMVFSCGCKAEIWATKGLLDKAKGNVLGMEVDKNHSGYTMRVSQSSISGDRDVEKNGKWSCIYAVGSQEYQMVCTRLDIASADVGMLDKFNRGLHTDVQVFVDFDYVIGRSITVMAGYRQVKVLEFFDCPGLRQGIEDLRELLHKVSDDDTAVTQRRLKDKQPEEKTNTDCLVKEQEKEYQTRWKIKTGNVLDSCNQSDWIHKAYRYAGDFWLVASIKKGMLEPVKVKCIFLVYHKNIVGNKLWRLDDVTSKVVLYRNMGFNESEEYKKTFIGSGVATVAGNAVTTSMAINGSIHKGLLDKAKGNVLGMEVDKNQSGHTLRVSQSRQTYKFLWILTTSWEDRSLSWEAIWLKGLLTESRYELRLVAGIATGALVKGGSRSEVLAQVEVAAYRY